MKTTHRLLALLLALVTLLSCAPVSIFAEETATPANTADATLIADTYVSAAYPDTVFGDRDELRLNGGKNEKIIFATYSSKLLEAKGMVRLTIPAANDAYVNAELFLLDAYRVDEEKLTYNTMPKLTDTSVAVSLGEYVLVGGNNTIELLAVTKSKVKGEYFTIAIRATSLEKDVYVFDYIPDDLCKSKENATSILDDTTYIGTNYAEATAYAHDEGSKIGFAGNFDKVETRNDDTKGETYCFDVTNMGAFCVYTP